MNFRDFDTCWERARETHEKLPGSRILQVAGYRGNTEGADPRWLELPQRAWMHYVVEKDGKVIDPSVAQFDPRAPKEYDYERLLDTWDKIYQVAPGHLAVRE